MGKTTTRKRGRNGGDEKPGKRSGWAVYEAEYDTKAPRGDALATFASRVEAEAFVKGLNFHDPKTLYIIEAP